jgi:8-oxo-dGTP pyrophosphatase MutT (NUDIX family)
LSEIFDKAQTSAVIAGRIRGGELQICLIRNVSSGKWGIPKGIVDLGHTPRETALNEAWEEAGLHGELLGRSIGSYIHRKWGTEFRVSVFLMKVTAEEETWEEMDFRERHWVKANEAPVLLRNHRVHSLLGRGLKIIAERIG